MAGSGDIPVADFMLRSSKLWSRSGALRVGFDGDRNVAAPSASVCPALLPSAVLGAAGLGAAGAQAGGGGLRLLDGFR